MVLLSLALLSSCGRSDQKLGQQVVDRIEKFRATHHRLPSSLADIGMKDSEEGPIYYKKQSETHYIVWYGMSFTVGESVTYDSETKKWE